MPEPIVLSAERKKRNIFHNNAGSKLVSKVERDEDDFWAKVADRRKKLAELQDEEQQEERKKKFSEH